MGRQGVPLKYSLGTRGLYGIQHEFRECSGGFQTCRKQRRLVWKSSEGFSKEGVDGRIWLRNSGCQWEGVLWLTLSQVGERMDQALLHLVIYIFNDASCQAQCLVPRTQMNKAIQCCSWDHRHWVRHTWVRVPELLPSSCVILVKLFNLSELYFSIL